MSCLSPPVSLLCIPAAVFSTATLQAAASSSQKLSKLEKAAPSASPLGRHPAALTHPTELWPASNRGQVLPHVALPWRTNLARVSTSHLVSVPQERQTHSCRVSSAGPFQVQSPSHPLAPGHSCSQGTLYRVRVFLDLAAYEVNVLILLAAQDFLLVLSLVV